jgi:hypothetical protein
MSASPPMMRMSTYCRVVDGKASRLWEGVAVDLRAAYNGWNMACSYSSRPKAYLLQAIAMTNRCLRPRKAYRQQCGLPPKVLVARQASDEREVRLRRPLQILERGVAPHDALGREAVYAWRHDNVGLHDVAHGHWARTCRSGVYYMAMSAMRTVDALDQDTDLDIWFRQRRPVEKAALVGDTTSLVYVLEPPTISIVVGRGTEGQSADVVEKVSKLGRMTACHLFAGDRQLELMSLHCGRSHGAPVAMRDVCPWKISAEQVEEHVSERLEIVAGREF